MKKIDIHVHTSLNKGVERLAGGTYASPAELVEIYKRMGIEKAVILPGINPECRSSFSSNEEIHALTQKMPDLFYWFCNIDPRMGNNSPESDLSHFINYYKQLGAKGVGEICANLYFDDPLVENLFFHCQKCRMPVLFHVGPQLGGCYGLIDEMGFPRLEKELEKFPQLQFIGHSQPFWAEIGADITESDRIGYPKGKVAPGRLVELMRKYPNLYGDLSADSGYNALSRDPIFGYAFIEEFQDRLYFGTDICDPRNDRKLSYWLDEAVGKGKISEQAYEKVCRENALKLLEG